MLNFYAKKTTILSAIFLVITTANRAQEPHLSLTPVITGLNTPVQVANAGDGTNRLFVVLQGNSNTAAVLVYSSTYVKLDTFLRVTNIATGGEQGLLSIAFHPQYANIASPFFGMFYVYYTNSTGDLEIARYKVSSNPDVADEASKDTVLTIPHPVNQNHNGGTIRFGPDGYLYLATGDGGAGEDPPNNAQNPNVMLGKMLRMDVTSSATAPFYTIPPDNPYVGVTSPDTLDIIYSFGLRNPFRWSFDRLTHDLWIGDVGQATWEEIDFSRADSTAGLNYGWRCYEGNAPHLTSGCGPISDFTFPIFTYPNPGPAAVTGGVVYRGVASANASLVGYFIAADYYSGTFYKIHPDGNAWTVYQQTALRTGVPSIGEAENGEIYVVSQFGSNVSLLSVDAVLPARLISFSARQVNDKIELRWKTAFEENLSHFDIEYSKDAVNFQKAGSVNAVNSSNGADYIFSHSPNYSGRLFYRLKMINQDNSSEMSSTISTQQNVTNQNFVRPSVIHSGVINIVSTGGYSRFELISMDGSVVLKQEISAGAGQSYISALSIPAGTYIAQLQSNSSVVRQKVIIR